MPRRPARFTQALRAAKQADVHIAIEIALDGTIRLVPIETNPTAVDPKVDPEVWKRFGERDAVL